MAVHAHDKATHRHAAALRHCPCSYGEAVRQCCLVGGADPNGTASGDPTDLRFDRPKFRARPTGLSLSSART
eukprot:1744131-Pleurochrysis_carterae.AAC.1